MDGTAFGRLKDIYFDDLTWVAKHLVVAREPSRFGQKQVVINPEHVRAIGDEGFMQMNLAAEQLENAPLAGSVAPICRQYAALAFSSPGARTFADRMAGADLHLRSARAVLDYPVFVAGEQVGKLTDFILNDDRWEVCFLRIEQVIEGRRLAFYVHPQCVERFTWAARRVLLRSLQPVLLSGAPNLLHAAA